MSAIYGMKPDRDNAYHGNAIAVLDGQRVVGYLSRKCADKLIFIFNEDIPLKTTKGKVFLRPKEKAEVRHYRKGPQQLVNVGFKCADDKVERVRSKLTSEGLNVIVKPSLH